MAGAFAARWKRTSCPAQLELRIVDRQGETRWIKHRGRPVFGENGRYLGIRGSNSDITERKLVEKALRESEERLRDFFDNAIDLIAERVPRRPLPAREPRVAGNARLHGRRRSRGSAWPTSSRRNAGTGIEEQFRQLMSGENRASIETTFLSKDGRRILVEGNINCRFVDGKPYAGRGIFRDVTSEEADGGGAAQVEHARVHRDPGGRDRARLQQHPHRRHGVPLPRQAGGRARRPDLVPAGGGGEGGDPRPEPHPAAAHVLQGRGARPPGLLHRPAHRGVRELRPPGIDHPVPDHDRPRPLAGGHRPGPDRPGHQQHRPQRGAGDARGRDHRRRRAERRPSGRPRDAPFPRAST